MSMIIVYSKPNCVCCEMVKRYLTDKGVPFGVIDVFEDDKSLAMLRDKGYSEMPVVDICGNIHTGFRPELLAKAVV